MGVRLRGMPGCSVGRTQGCGTPAALAHWEHWTLDMLQLLVNDGSEFVVVAAAFTSERAEEESFPPAISSCVQATLGGAEIQRELLSISLTTWCIALISHHPFLFSSEDFFRKIFSLIMLSQRGLISREWCKIEQRCISAL